MADALPAGFTLDAPPAPPPPGGYQLDAGSSPDLSDTQKSFLNTTAVGRVMGAFGSGLKTPFQTDEPYGLSQSSLDWLRKMRVITDTTQKIDPIRYGVQLFNEGLILPAAKDLDAAWRAAESPFTSLAAGIGQIGEETGIATTLGYGRGGTAPGQAGDEVRQDILGALETLPVVMGAHLELPTGIKLARQRTIASTEGLMPSQIPIDGKAAELGAKPPVIERPPMPMPEELVNLGPLAPGEIKPNWESRDMLSKSQSDLQYVTKHVTAGNTIQATGGLSDTDLSKIGTGFNETRIGETTISGKPAVIFQSGKRSVNIAMMSSDYHDLLPEGERPGSGIPGYKSSNTPSIVGTAKIESNGNLEHVVVSPALRRQGLGTKLIELAEQHLGAKPFAAKDRSEQGAALLESIRQKRLTETAQPPPPPPPPEMPPLTPSGPPEMPSKAGNINLDRINAPEDVKQVITETAHANQDFETARRGRMTFEDISSLADAAGMTPAELAKRKVGQAFNAEQAVAARNLLVASATKVRELAKTAIGGDDEAIAAFQQAITRHAAIQEQVSGLTAEAGRALASFNIKSVETDRAKALLQVIEGAGGRKSAEAMAEAIANLDTPEQISRFIGDSRKPGFIDKVVEAWINGLLSGPATHATNIVSNALTAVNATLEQTIAAGFGALHGGEKVTFGQAGARAYATIQGAKEGAIAAGRTIIGKDPATGKVEAMRQQAIGGVAGTIIRTPMRLLGGEDAFFKGVLKRQEIAQLAYAQAEKEKLTGHEFANRIAELSNNPTEKMLEKANDAAAHHTFNRPLGEMGQAVQKFFNTHPILKFIAPFIRTPVDIVKYAAERSPLSLFSQEVRDNLAGKNGAIARDTQAARLTLGTSVITASLAMASNGQITGGGPTDPRARALLYMSGWQPYSVKIGDTYYSYARLDPFATLMGSAADAYEIRREVSASDSANIGGLLLASVSRNLLNKTWLQGPSAIMQAVDDPDRYGESWLRSFVGSFVPTGAAQLARANDPYIRDVRTMIDAIKARVPGLSEEVPVKRDLWGNPLQREGALGPDILSPIYQTQIKNDPIAREMLRLGIWKAQVPRQIRGVQLTPDQYDEFQRMAGRQTRTMLDQIVGTEAWSSAPPHAQAEIIDHAFNSAREAARNYMMMRHPDLLQGVITNRVQQITGQLPKAGLIAAPPNPELVQ